MRSTTHTIVRRGCANRSWLARVTPMWPIPRYQTHEAQERRDGCDVRHSSDRGHGERKGFVIQRPYRDCEVDGSGQEHTPGDDARARHVCRQAAALGVAGCTQHKRAEEVEVGGGGLSVVL